MITAQLLNRASMKQLVNRVNKNSQWTEQVHIVVEKSKHNTASEQSDYSISSDQNDYSTAGEQSNDKVAGKQMRKIADK